MSDKDRVAELEEQVAELQGQMSRQLAEFQKQVEEALQDPDGLWIDGAKYTEDDLEFAERRLLREESAKLAPDGEYLGQGFADIDYVPVVVWLVRRRENPEYTLEEAMKVKHRDLKPPPDPTPAASPSDAAGDQPT